jgi:hypothetical protein
MFTAATWFHRFYMRRSLEDYHRQASEITHFNLKDLVLMHSLFSGCGRIVYFSRNQN